MRNINFLIKPASSLCNLRCRYCFYADEAENRNVANYGIMSSAVSEKILDRAFASAAPGDCVSFAFQGGEPTLAGLEFFRYFTEAAKTRRPKDVRVEFAIQTNGILLDNAWADFFAENGYLVGISLDGYGELHNLYRKGPNDQDTWPEVVKKARMLQEKQVKTNALCVVTAQTAKHPGKVYRELKKLGFSYMQFIACLDPIGEERGKRSWSLTPEAYRSFLCGLFDLWYRDWEQGNYHSVRLFDDYIHLLLGDGASTCSTCGRCGSYFVVEADGTVYPCDFFAMDSWNMGNITEKTLEELYLSPAAQSFMKLSGMRPVKCGSCRWNPLCGGGCLNDRVREGEDVRNYFCEAFRGFLEYASGRMLIIARAEQSLRQRMGGR